MQVQDKEDKQIDSKKIKVYSNYNPQPSTINKHPLLGHQTMMTLETNSLGKTLIANSDCKACHTVDKVSVGPAFVAVANRYKKQNGAVERLAQKIITGGGGNWGKEHVMSAHPQIPQKDAEEMVKYIFSLTDAKKQLTTLPVQGSLTLKDHQEIEPRGQYTLLATYTDKGTKAVGALTSTEVITLRNAKVRAIDADAHTGFQRFGNNLSLGNHKSFILLKNIDLTNIKGFTYEYNAPDKDGEIEVRIGSYAGPIVSKTAFKANGNGKGPKQVKGELALPVAGRHDVYFVVVKRDKPNNDLISLNTIQFEQ